MLGEALSFPRRSDDWLKTILIGGVLSFFGGLLLIPLLPVQGYLVRVLRAGVRGDRETPVFDDWGELFVDGLLLFLVQLVYSIVPIVLFTVGVFVFAGGAVLTEGGSSGAAAGLGIVGLLVFGLAGLLTLFVVYLLPAALANFAHEDDFAAAFDLRRVAEGAFTSHYLVAVVLALVVALTLGFLAAALTVLIVGIFLTFYVQMVLFFLLGRGYGKGLDIEPGQGTDGRTDDPEIDPLT